MFLCVVVVGVYDVLFCCVLFCVSVFVVDVCFLVCVCCI